MTIETRLNPGEKCVFLRAQDGSGAVQLLAFVAARRALEVWQTPDERRVPQRRTGTYREPLEPLRIAHLLASGEAGAHLAPALAAGAVIEGVGDEWEPVLRSAWGHGLASRDANLHALLSTEPGLLDACLARAGSYRELDDYLELAGHLVEQHHAWLARWRGAIEEVVRTRIAALDEVSSPDEHWRPSEAEIRSFVERCVLKLGRLPLDEEDPEDWAGKDLAATRLSQARRARAGLDVDSKIGRYHVRATYLSPLDTYGYDFYQGTGWYLVVLNPNINWTFNDPAGPYLSPEDAFDDGSFLAEQE
jgi:hypothetical protein